MDKVAGGGARVPASWRGPATRRVAGHAAHAVTAGETYAARRHFLPRATTSGAVAQGGAPARPWRGGPSSRTVARSRTACAHPSRGRGASGSAGAARAGHFYPRARSHKRPSGGQHLQARTELLEPGIRREPFAVEVSAELSGSGHRVGGPRAMIVGKRPSQGRPRPSQQVPLYQGGSILRNCSARTAPDGNLGFRREV